MARKTTPQSPPQPSVPLWRRIKRAALLGLVGVVGLVLVYAVALRWVNPPTTPYIWSQGRQFDIAQDWVPLDAIAPDMRRAVLAAEDANFCAHWGFDMAAIRGALQAGGSYGASTLTQQMVKNVFLWHGRSWPRKALEALLTPLVELTLPKSRIMEIYLNIAEFGPGIFGVEEAALHYFDRGAEDLTLDQAARLAAILPAPKSRDPLGGSGFMRKRVAAIADGAQTLAREDRAHCVRD